MSKQTYRILFFFAVFCVLLSFVFSGSFGIRCDVIVGTNGDDYCYLSLKP